MQARTIRRKLPVGGSLQVRRCSQRLSLNADVTINMCQVAPCVGHFDHHRTTLRLGEKYNAIHILLLVWTSEWSRCQRIREKQEHLIRAVCTLGGK